MTENALDLPLSHPHVHRLKADRARRIKDELTFALSRTRSDVLAAWGRRAGLRYLKLGALRGRALFGLLATLGRSGAAEVRGLIAAGQAGRLGEQVGDRSAAAIDSSIAIGKAAARLARSLGQALAEDPRRNGPAVLAAFLGFYAGSGGVDGDGGIPDLDLLAGIDAHRALFTHSVLAGIAAEGTLLALADLAGEIHDRLPRDHDRLWDTLADAASPLTDSLTAGMSAGIAYHLLWDAAIEPAPYKDLPVEMSLEAHAAVLAANGLAEGAYAAGRMRTDSPALLTQGPPAGPSAGRRVVDGIVQGARQAGAAGREFMGRFKRG